jgi:3',5'-cyclic AMP phosphodiesterase CpdA
VKNTKKNAVLGISLGDLVGDNLSLQKPYADVMKEVGLPWYNVMGNHDMNYDAKEDKLSDETFESNFGPANYSFNYGNVHFIILDDILYPDPRDGKGYWGGFREDQLQFIENDLKLVDKNKLIVVSFHIPLEHKNEDSFRNADRQKLFDF